MKRELIEKKELVSDKTKVMVFKYNPNGKRSSVTGLFKELTDNEIVIMNKYQVVSFKLNEIVGVQVLESRRPKNV